MKLHFLDAAIMEKNDLATDFICDMRESEESKVKPEQ